MKAVHKLAAGLAVAGLAATAAIAARPMPIKVSPKADGSASGIAAAAAGFNYATDFEATGAPGGYNTLGYINNGAGLFPAGCGGVAAPCFGHTTGAGFSLITPTIDTNFPASGTQHLRVTPDGTTRTNIANFGLGVDARFPRTADLSVRPIAPNTVSINLSISNSQGQDFRVQPQSNSQGLLATSALFFYAGGIYILDDVCGSVGLNFQPTGVFWDTTGAYQNYTVGMDPCHDTTVYLYGNAPLYASCVPAGTNLEQFLIFGDNFPGSEARVDDLVMSSLEECISECGNGVVEGPNEQCDDGHLGFPVSDANCPGRCTPNCTCTPICTQANPCPVVNGANGPFIASDGFYSYVGGSPFVSVDSCGSNFDSFIDITGGGTGYNDNCNNGQFGADHDTSASCYEDVTNANAYPSCVCVANDGSPMSIEIGSFGFLAGQGAPTSTMVNVRKKAVCEGASVGACCDTNGADQGCTDNVTQANCMGADKVWTNQGKCASTHCECIPDCTGRTCGSDGCGGSCGVCGDGNVCNGDETCNAQGTCDAGQPLNCSDGNACNGNETCNPSSGCVPGTPLNCDNGVACDGIESCNPSSGCVAGTPVNCDDGQDCSVDTCNEPDGSCSHDDADCSIPTVSEWGLVVLTLMLLIGAKVYFGRRQAIA
jgi:hypothetical protein